MNYIQKTAEGLKIVDEHTTKILSKGMRQFLNDMMLTSLSTYPARMTAIRNQYNLKYHVPIYVNESICFYAVQSMRRPDALCINYHNVLSIRPTEDNHTEIIFKNLNIIKLIIPFQTVFKRHTQTAQFLERHQKNIG